MRFLRSAKDLRGKRVLVRVDFNVENSADALRLKKSLPTIKYLRNKGAAVILLSHLGRPKKPSAKLSLRKFLPFLKKNLGKVEFLTLIEKARNLKPGSVFLLENLRFNPGEEAGDKKFAKRLAALGDIYVNDAFAVSHRTGASITVLPKLLPSYAGLLLEEEIKQLSKALKPKKPLVVIVGGGKARDKFEVIENLYSKASSFLIGGVLANTFFKARGMKISNSVVDESLLESVKKFIKDEKIVLPIDWITDKNGKILDIGPLSAEWFNHRMEKAGTIIWNGPMGFFEDPKYAAGSMAIAKQIIKSKAFSIIGGGETTQFLLENNLEKKFDFVSTGGGAMLAFLAGKDLPGIKALK